MSFSPFLHSVLRAITPFIFSKSVGGEIVADDENYFSRIVYSYTGKRISFAQQTLGPCFPQLKKVGTVFQNEFVKIQAGATGLSDEESVEVTTIKAKGEFLERLSTVLPFEYIQNKESEKKDVKYQNKPLKCKNLLSFFGSSYIEQEYLFYALHFKQLHNRTQPLLWQPTSSGCAGHFDKKKALVNATLELIQRDAFFVWWLTNGVPRHIDVETYARKQGGEILNLLEQIKKYNLEVYFLDTTSDILVPSITVVITSEDKGEKVPFGVGSASGFLPLSIILGALTEALSVANFSHRSESFILPTPYKPFSDKRLDREERLRVYSNKKQREYSKFFYSSQERVTVEGWVESALSRELRGDIQELQKSEKKQLEYLKKIFKEKRKTNKAYDLFYYEFKNPLLATFDYKVVRVICKGLYSIYLNESFADTKHPRLQEFFKYTYGRDFDYTSINKWPHPFP